MKITDIMKTLEKYPLARYPVYVLIFFIVSSTAGLVSFLILSAGLTVTVPDVTDMSISKAESALESIGLSLRVVNEEYNQTVPSGHVIEQDIEPGTHIRGHAEVKVALSKGPEVRLIPSVIGESIENARNLFLQKGIAIQNVIEVHSGKKAEGKIIAQRPAPEEWTGGGVTLVVSMGPHDVVYYCPSFQGMLKNDAMLLATELGLGVKLAGSSEADTDLQVVTKQKPPPGDEIKMGDKIYLTIGGSNG